MGGEIIGERAIASQAAPARPKREFSAYSMEEYLSDVESRGLDETWSDICAYILDNGESEGLLNIKNFGEMYETALAGLDKSKKKRNGQYFTPYDVASLMGEWLDGSEGENVCDVACGTGKLILAYLDRIGEEKAVNLLREGRVYLYDRDATALKICKASLLARYGVDLACRIHDVCCDFLDRNVILPDNCKTVSNPPYGKIGDFGCNWDPTDAGRAARELYASFMEKIFDQSESAVVITPFSFISAGKYYALRKEMCDLGAGFIVAFDNVPGNIFCGRKRGVFNTNASNSVRAAITVFHKSGGPNGFRVSPLIRFKSEERGKLLKSGALERTLNPKIQTVNEEDKSFKKIDKELQDVYDAWVGSSLYVLKDFLAKGEGKYLIDVPNTCRYGTVAASKRLKRRGVIALNFNDAYAFYFIYCFINSSFPYWWWRIYDGGITYSVNLLSELPIPYNLLRDKEKEEFKKIALEMMRQEGAYISIKVNAGAEQENIKFPKKYRDLIDGKILKLIGGMEPYKDKLEAIHANNFFKGC